MNEQGHRNDFHSGRVWSLKSGMSSGNNIETLFYDKVGGSAPRPPQFRRP